MKKRTTIYLTPPTHEILYKIYYSYIKRGDKVPLSSIFEEALRLVWDTKYKDQVKE